MTALPYLLTAWGIAVAAFVAVMIYRGNLTRHEADQLFLAETAPSVAHVENDDIVRRVNQIQPLCQGLGGVSVLLTVAIIGIYVASILPDVKFN